MTYRLFSGPSAEMTTWQHWFASDAIGIVIVAPLVIELATALRQPPPRSELIEGTAALAALAVMTAIAISLPQSAGRPWCRSRCFPILLWIAARCRPVFAAAAAFLVSTTVVSTAVFGLGHFGDASLSFADQIPQAQAVILFVALGVYVLAALFAERRENEGAACSRQHDAGARTDNKLMSAQALTGSIAHEVRRPWRIVSNASAALRCGERTPPDHDELRAALNRIQSESHRTSEVFDAIRALFRKGRSGATADRCERDYRRGITVAARRAEGPWIEARSKLTNSLLLTATGLNCARSFLIWPTTRSKQWTRRPIEAGCCG